MGGGRDDHRLPGGPAHARRARRRARAALVRRARRLARRPLFLQRAVAQLNEYFAGSRHSFDLPLAPSGTEFQLACWRALAEIPYGETRSYGEQARRIGRPDRARAVGAANGANPIAIILPCHRVIGADGSLVGFGGGLETKRRLLDLEAGILTLV